MENRSKYLFKNMGILTISNFASKILVFLLVPLYTNILSKEDVGIYDLVVSTVTLLYPILTVNISDAVMRFLMDKTKKRYEVALVGIRFLIFSFFLGIIVLLLGFNLQIFEGARRVEIYVFLYYITYVTNHFFVQFAKGVEQVTDMGVSGVIGTIIMLAANILFLYVYKLGLKGFFLANILSQSVSAFYLLWRIRLYKYFKQGGINKTLQKEMLFYCAPLITTAVGWWVNSASDKYVVSFICGVAANGLLSVSYKIPQILNTIQQIFIQAWQISAIKEYGENNTPVFYGKTFGIVNFMMCVTGSVLILLTKPIGHILYQKDFFAAWEFVPFLLLASIINCASGLLGPILSAKKEPKPLAVSAIAGAFANIVLNILLVFLIGIQGATIATVISSIIIYAIRKQSVKNDIQINHYIVIVSTWVLIAIQAIIEIYTGNWLVEILIMVVILVANKSTCKEFIRMLISMFHKKQKAHE